MISNCSDKTLLVAEDDRTTRLILRSYLEDAGYRVVDASTGHRIFQLLQEFSVDLLILDIHLSDGNCLDWLPGIREYTAAPIIMLSSEEALTSKITSFDRGADDFVVKPCHADELLAHIRARLKVPVTSGLKPKSTVNGWLLDTEQQQFFTPNGTSCDLTPAEYRLMQLLVQAEGKPIARQRLCEALKNASYIPTPRAIDIKVARIRKKLEEHHGSAVALMTVHGIGYRWYCE
ncbi:MAG: hypothetical protein CMM93_03435 [Rickettsiales bacterium]|nr:hypothetical protein [Rickettsiales bacterium]